MTMKWEPNSTSADVRRIQQRNGFSIIELLIVVAIVLIIAAIAIPSFLRARIAAQEAAAAGNTRSIVSANVAYSSTYGNGYAPSLGALGAPAGTAIATCDNAILIDEVLSNNGAGNNSTKSGYTYTYVPGNVLALTPPGCTPGLDGYTLLVNPVLFQMTGIRRFYADPSGVIRYTSDGSAPNNLSPALQ